MTKLIRVAALTIFLALPAMMAMAQPGGGNPPGDPEGDVDKVPFTGLEYLLISGGIYGGVRLLKKTDKKTQA